MATANYVDYSVSNDRLVLSCIACNMPICGEVRGSLVARGIIKAAKEHIDEAHGSWRSNYPDRISGANDSMNEGLAAADIGVLHLSRWSAH